MWLVASLLVLAGAAQAGTPAGRHGLEIDLQSLEADVEAMVAQAKGSHGLEEDMLFDLIKHGFHAVFGTPEEQAFARLKEDRDEYCAKLQKTKEDKKTMTNFGPFFLCGYKDAYNVYTGKTCDGGVDYTGVEGSNSQRFDRREVLQMYNKLCVELKLDPNGDV